MISGSAPINGEILNFLKVCFCCPIREGYGQTECTAAAAATSQNDGATGHVGGPFPCIKLRIKDIPDMNYLSSDPNPRGELCFKGDSVFKGYFKAADKNVEVFDSEGWLGSGDVAELLPNGAIKIIDRVKNLFKLS
jgi:long-chain acyl-CoA synthetase